MRGRIPLLCESQRYLLRLHCFVKVKGWRDRERNIIGKEGNAVESNKIASRKDEEKRREGTKKRREGTKRWEGKQEEEIREEGNGRRGMRSREKNCRNGNQGHEKEKLEIFSSLLLGFIRRESDKSDSLPNGELYGVAIDLVRSNLNELKFMSKMGITSAQV